MKKKEFKNLEQDLYTFTLANGLKVFLVPFSKKKHYYVVLGTKYGSNDIEFKLNNHFYKTPAGTAHFLEHKMFEQENGEDPFAFFSKSGVNVNASTSYDNTKYYIWGVNDLEKNLDYFLNFVYSPYFTDENILKEKDIIKEEILMYEDEPEWALDDQMRKNLFYNLPAREKISGTIDSLQQIQKKDLELAYKTFYNPNNMFLVIGGNFEPEKIEKLITNHEILNSLTKKPKIKRQVYKEPNDVNEEYTIIYKNITVPKIRFSIKINKDSFRDFSNIELDMYFVLLLHSLFGITSNFKEKVEEQDLTSDFYIEKNHFYHFITIDITAESEKADMFVDEVKKVLKNIKISKEELERFKKSMIANEIRMIDSLEETVDNICGEILNYNRVYTNPIFYIKKLNISKLKLFLKQLNLKNQSLVLELPMEEKI